MAIKLNVKIPTCSRCGKSSSSKNQLKTTSDSQVVCEKCAVAAATPLRQVNLRPGRNQPCPCGSGRKYKACCKAFERG